jgi:preprotein translocase subunit Sec61beta
MAPKRKRLSVVAAIIPPIDPKSQLLFAGNHLSIITESYLFHLVEIGVLPPKELCSWRICRGVTVPTEDTHESIVYVSFLIRGLAILISPFFRGLLDFYELNLTHLNPNSILQVAIFVHLCEAFLGILPHFGL